MNNKIKLISLLCLSVGITACSGSSPNNSPGNTVSSEFSEVDATRAVIISRTPTIPTNGGSIGNHYLRVDNHSGEDLKLVNFNVSQSSHSSFIRKAYDKVNRAFGGYGSDARIGALNNCDTLVSGASCSVAFTPDEKDGSTALQLNFKDSKNNIFSAAQLLDYSSGVAEVDGFIVDNKNIRNVITKNNYSITIPFIVNDNYKSIDVASRIMTIDKSIDCAGGASKGAHCTATLTLPVADRSANYANKITITGHKADNSARVARIDSGSSYGEFSTLSMSGGPLLIVANAADINKNKKSLLIVNNGVKEATAVSMKREVVASFYNGTISTSNSYLTFTPDATSCTGSIQPGTFCTVNVELDQNTLTASGHDSYQLQYAGGENGADNTKDTHVYYRGLNNNCNGDSCVQYSYDVYGQYDFTGTKVGETASTDVKIVNTGSQAIKDVKLDLRSLATSGFSSDDTDCASKVLAYNQQCIIKLTYKPTAAVALTGSTITITAAKEADGATLDSQDFVVKYSAVQTGSSGLVFIGTPKFNIASNGKESASFQVRIQNTGELEYNLNSITTSGSLSSRWPDALNMSAPDTFKDADGNEIANIFKPISSTNGFFTVDAANTIALKAGESAALNYTYGPVTKDDNGFAVQVFTGKFNGTEKKYNLTTTYQTSSSPITVVVDPVINPDDGNDLLDGGEFTLVKSNPFNIDFTYTLTEDVKDFLVTDHNLSAGFMVDAGKTTCPTTSLANSPKDMSVGTCKVSYIYVPEDMGDKFFYTQFADSQLKTIKIPAYQFRDGSNMRVVSPDNTFTFTPHPFAKITPVVAKTGQQQVNSATYDVYKVTFTLDDYKGQALLGNGSSIQINFNLPATNDAVGSGGFSCAIASDSFDSSNISKPKCEIELMTPKDNGIQGGYAIYSSSTDGDYNSIYQTGINFN